MKLLFKFAIYLFVGVGVSSVNAGAYEDFFRAVNVDDARTVGNLLERGFDPNSPDEKGNVGLLLAIRSDSPKVANALLAHPGIRVDAANAVGETALMMAALRGQGDWCQRLLDRGAQVNREGWTPLHYAASGPEAKVVTLLLDRGARIDSPSPNRTTPLMMASRYGTDSAAEALIARGADAKLRNDQGLNAADFARLGARPALAAKLDQLAR